MTTLSLLLLSSFLCVFSNALSCSLNYQCEAVSTNYNYVLCVNNTCLCRTSLGFTGTATTESKCSCDSPLEVFWLVGEPYCISYQNAVNFQAQEARNEIIINVVKAVYDALIFPTPSIIMQSLILNQPTPIDHLFAVNSAGRVDPAGTFFNQDSLVEYFYGLVWIGSTRISKINFTKIIAFGNKVAMRVILTLDQMSPDQSTVLSQSNLTQTGFFTFNDQNTIQSTELSILNLGWHSDGFFPQNNATLETVCFLITVVANCNATHDPSGFYTNFADCMNFLYSTEWGTWAQLRDNTVMCRSFHALLAIGRPSIHCSHSGKTGGGKCTTHNYVDYYLEEF